MMLTKDQYEKASVIFAEYFVKNYPGPDTVIHRPHSSIVDISEEQLKWMRKQIPRPWAKS
jgi:hypothetical protein